MITLLLIFGSFARIALVFKVLCAALLSYLVVAVLVTHQWGTVLDNTVVPHLQLSRAYLALLVATLGTTISPYLFFWQSAHRIEEMREESAGGAKAQPLKQRSPARARRKQRTSRVDVLTGMLFSNLVMFAIIIATAQTLHAHHQTSIESAAQAATALKPVAGHFASLLFALGFIGSGLLTVPVLAGAGSAGMAGLLGKEWGFSRSVRKAPVFYGLVAIGTVGGDGAESPPRQPDPTPDPGRRNKWCRCRPIPYRRNADRRKPSDHGSVRERQTRQDRWVGYGGDHGRRRDSPLCHRRGESLTRPGGPA